MVKAIRWLRNRLHRHCWRPTVYNGYLMEVEQRCRRCGAYRWHGLEHRGAFGEEPHWQAGKHPNYSEEQRRRYNQGLYDFSRRIGTSEKESLAVCAEPEYVTRERGSNG